MTGSFTVRVTLVAASLIDLGFTHGVVKTQGEGATACIRSLH